MPPKKRRNAPTEQSPPELRQANTVPATSAITRSNRSQSQKPRSQVRSRRRQRGQTTQQHAEISEHGADNPAEKEITPDLDVAPATVTIERGLHEWKESDALRIG